MGTDFLILEVTDVALSLAAWRVCERGDGDQSIGTDCRQLVRGGCRPRGDLDSEMITARQQNTCPRSPRDHSSRNWEYETRIHVRFNATAGVRRVSGRSESNDAKECDTEPAGQFCGRRCARRSVDDHLQ